VLVNALHDHGLTAAAAPPDLITPEARARAGMGAAVSPALSRVPPRASVDPGRLPVTRVARPRPLEQIELE